MLEESLTWTEQLPFMSVPVHALISDAEAMAARSARTWRSFILNA